MYAWPAKMTTFVTSPRYLDRSDQVDLESDGVRYSKGTLYLNALEFEQVQAGIQALLLPLLENTAEEGRRPYIFSNVLLPSEEGSSDITEQQ
jgi:hypothetical protein